MENVINSATMPFVVSAITKVFVKEEKSHGGSHDSFEMVYVKSGTGVFEFGRSNIEVGPNDLVVIRPHASHRFLSDDRNTCELVLVYFSFADNFGSTVESQSAKEFLGYVNKEDGEPAISVKVRQKNDIITCMNRIIEEQADNGEDLSEEMQRLLMQELFILVSRVLKTEYQNTISRAGGQKVKELIKISENYIRNNYERELDLSTIAGKVFLSPSYFIRVFREETGLSPINYLLKVRIENAKEMLKTTNMKVRDIATAVGFSNQQRFNEMFRKFTSMTPLEFRRTCTQ